jgi:NADPH-dependent 2,4-dienoyl-CoA reductase/sulfur reductase-like enzyme/rhodanese-related sulfurtransferase
VKVKAMDNGRAAAIPYDKLVIATGARPIRPRLPGVDLANVFTLHGVRDAEGIRSHLDGGRAHDVVIVGGGLIGVETTEALVSRGCRVTIVEMQQQILQILDADMAALLERHMEAHGVRVLTRTQALGFVGNSQVEGVTTDTHGVIPADLVILGVGVRAESTLARAAGLEIGDTGGIRVDQRMLTSDPDIYAAGDCVECTDQLTGRPCFVPLGSTANKQGRVAAVNLCGGNESFPGVLGSTVCRVFDYCVGRTGLTEREALDAGYQIVTVLAAAPEREHFMPGTRNLMIKLVADATNRRLLGLQTLGSGGDKRIDVAATAITAGMTVDQVAALDLCYAPPYAPAMDNLITAANIARNKLDGRLQSIAPREVWEKLQRKEDLLLLDVSTPAEYEALRLPGSLLIPLGTLRARLAELPRDRDIVVYCRLSIRGYEAAMVLQAAGFDRVRVLDGGTAMWPYDAVTGKT